MSPAATATDSSLLQLTSSPSRALSARRMHSRGAGHEGGARAFAATVTVAVSLLLSPGSGGDGDLSHVLFPFLVPCRGRQRGLDCRHEPEFQMPR